ncbi:MAG: hypothetical protein ABL874_10740, partial [Sphingopyxis sp.]
MRARAIALRDAPCPPTGQPNNSVQIAAGVGLAEIPTTNVGFVRDGPTSAEQVLLRNRLRVNMVAVEGEIDVRAIGRVSFAYLEGDAQNSVDVPAGAAGSARGFPYTARSPSGSTGIAGNVPVRATTEVNVREFSGGYRHHIIGPNANHFNMIRAPLSTDSKPAPIIIAYGGIDVVHRERDHRGMVSITTPVIATQTLDQRVKEFEIGLTAGIRTAIPFGSGARLTLGGEVGAYHYGYDLRALETVSQNFGPLNDRAFTTPIEDSKSGIGFRGTANAELAIEIGSGFEFFLAGTASHSSHRAQVINPPNGDFVLAGGTTLLDT